MYATPIPTQQQPLCVVPLSLQPHHNLQQQYLIPVTTNNNRSLTLIGFGIGLLSISTILFFICTWIITIYSGFTLNYLTIFCCLYHLILSVLTIIGGKDVVKNRCLIGVCMGLAIVGASVVSTIALGYNASSWITANFNCQNNCYRQYRNDHDDFPTGYCNIMCVNARSVHVPVILLISIQGILDIIISIVNCTNICQCCGAPRNPGQILQPQFYLQQQYNSQPVSNNPSYSYSFQQPPYNPANPRPTQEPPTYDFLIPQANIAVNA